MNMDPLHRDFKLNGNLGIRRTVCESDFLNILNWRSDSDTYPYTKSSRIPTKDEHFVWSTNRLKMSPEQPYFGYEIDHKLISITRLDRVGIEASELEISVLVNPNVRRLGIATFCIKDTVKFGLEREGIGTISAWIHVNNITSEMLFMKCGFKNSNTRNGSFQKFAYNSLRNC